MDSVVHIRALASQVVPIFVNEAAYYSVQSGKGIGLCEAVMWPLGDDLGDDLGDYSPVDDVNPSGVGHTFGVDPE